MANLIHKHQFLGIVPKNKSDDVGNFQFQTGNVQLLKTTGNTERVNPVLVLDLDLDLYYSTISIIPTASKAK